MGGIKTHIVGKGGRALKINGEGEISVTTRTHPPLEEEITTIPYRSYFKNGASNDMRVDGSVTNVAFSLNADNSYDYYIKTLSIKIADAGAKFNLFGTLAALTNGVSFTWDSTVLGTSTLHEGIKDNQGFYRLSIQTPSIIDLSGGGADAIIVHVDLSSLFGTPWGVRLRKNTTDKLTFTVKDNLSAGLDTFNIIGYGIKL